MKKEETERRSMYGSSGGQRESLLADAKDAANSSLN